MRIAIILSLALIAGCAVSHIQPPHGVPAFRKGDAAIARHWSAHPGYEGELVTVTGDMQWRWVKELQGNAMRVYEVQTSDGQKFAAQEFQLAHVK